MRFAALTVFALTLGAAAPAIAGEFDARGVYHPSPNAVASIEFGADFDVAADYFTPAQAPAECKPGSTVVTPADPFSGSEVLHVALKGFGCADRFIVHGLPARKAAYRATLWMRHGGIADGDKIVLGSAAAGFTIVAATAVWEDGKKLSEASR